MAVISEDYVSLEIAELLKDKGFNEPTWTRYEDDNEVIFGDKYDWNNSPMGQTSAPTHQMAIKWLREVHNFYIWVEPNHDEEGLYNAHVKVGWWINNWAGVGYKTYEQACEAAIKYCLENLI